MAKLVHGRHCVLRFVDTLVAGKFQRHVEAAKLVMHLATQQQGMMS